MPDIGQAAVEDTRTRPEHRWRLHHRNGNILAGDGQRYSDTSGMGDGIESMKQNAPNAGFDKRKTGDTLPVGRI